ncbi:YczE/YyaS/YitT family protein [Nocardioides pakistanensis]
MGGADLPGAGVAEAGGPARVVQYLQLVLACTVLGVGVALLLEASMGSDGYSTLVSGLTLATGVPFWLMNILVGAAFIGLAWVRGTRPGPGTLVQWFLVGIVISAVMAVVPEPTSLAVRAGLLVPALALIAVGVAAYLASATGAGPAEAMALAWDPPLPFRWSYNLVQFGGAAAGWLLGAAVGPATVLVFLLLGPLVDLFRRTFPRLERGPRPRA